MTPFEVVPYDVVLVPFPFTDLRATKRRPCLVLAVARPLRMPVHFVVAMMTSQVERRFPHDVLLRDPAAAGLPKATLVRVFKLVTLDESLQPRRLGSLVLEDRRAVLAELDAVWAGLRAAA